ncbi:MAG: winged helix-turn-helix transcriptional regulator [Methanoregulaceae archaeon]|nr:winged helix-turn-helix transcriptional regulator [Methanoregulaceae archaeon]
MKALAVIVVLLVVSIGVIPVAVPDVPDGQVSTVISQGNGLHRGPGIGQNGQPGEAHRYGPPEGRGPAQGQARHGQGRNAAECAREEMRRDPTDRDLLTLIRRYRLGGYRRIFGKNVLDHEKRRALHDIIVRNPGIDLQALSLLTGIHPGTLRYHLDQLVSLRKIAVLEVGGVFRFYENHGRFDQRQKKVIARQWYATTRKILDLIKVYPGISRGEIADRVGISGPSATRWLKQFLSEGIVREIRDGRFSRYYITAA